MTVLLAPSILSADMTRLGDEIRRAEAGGADWIHLDVMDGHFVPNISFGVGIAQAVRGATTLPLDVHLMVEAPERYLPQFADVGVQSITVHEEACRHLHRTVQEIHRLGLRAGVALNPATPVDALSDILPDLDLVLVMSVNPGFGGQKFIPASLAKVERVAAMTRAIGRTDIAIEVDGGVDTSNIRALVEAGATVLVAGSAVFRPGDSPEERVAALRAAYGGPGSDH